MATVSHPRHRNNNLKVLKGYKDPSPQDISQALPEHHLSEVQVCPHPLKVVELEWTLVGEVKEFPVHQPKVTVIHRQQLSPMKNSSPVYVLRKGQRDFLILDMNSGGQYEQRVLSGRLYVRRLIPRTV